MFFTRIGTRVAARLVRIGYATASDNEMAFTFASHNQVYYDKANVKQVDVRSFSEAVRILPPNQAPTFAVLKPGVLSVIEADNQIQKYFVSFGSITVNDDSSVQILVEEAAPVDQIDATAALSQLSAAQQELSRASSAKDKAEAQIAVEVAQALVDASK